MNLHPRAGILATVITLSVLVVAVPASQLASAASPHEMASSMLAVTGTLPPDPAACATKPGGGAIPVGQANPPGSESEPIAPIWCYPLAAPGAPTRVSGANDWVDTFQGVTNMGRFQDGDYDYRTYSNVHGGTDQTTGFFTNNNHWMVDQTGPSSAGTSIRPNRSFRFENGKLVVEADVAAGISAYGADPWPEITISGADSPFGHPITDFLYMYGRFGGFETYGCRLTANVFCAYESVAPVDGNSTGPCLPTGPNRQMELGFFEVCGNVHSGGTPTQYARRCDSVAQAPDMQCRDRFRMELSKNGLKYYINGVLNFEDSGWPAAHQLPDAMVNGSMPLYVYFSNIGAVDPANVYRFHWQRLAVNPHNPDGSFLAPSAAPSFCLGQPNNTCAMGVTPVPNTPVPTQVPNTPVPPTNTPAATSTSVARHTCEVSAYLDGVETRYKRPLSFCTNQP